MFLNEFDFMPVKALKQHWTQARFSYMEKPRPDYGIMLVLNGRMDFVSCGQDTIRAAGGDLLFLPKNARYEVRFRTEFGPIDNYLVNFETNQPFDCEKPMLLLKDVSFGCINLFARFIDEVYKSEVTHFKSRGMFYILLDAVHEQLGTKKSAIFNIVEKAKNLLCDPAELSVQQIAQRCSVSESGLRKMFSDTLGISPVQHRRREKMNQARYLLEATDLPVGEIADQLHFYDAAYFCRVFYGQTGMTPKQYRQNKKL